MSKATDIVVDTGGDLFGIGRSVYNKTIGALWDSLTPELPEEDLATLGKGLQKGIDQPRRVTFGRDRVGGVIAHQAEVERGDKKYMQLIVLINGAPIDALEEIYIADKPITDYPAGSYDYELKDGRHTTASAKAVSKMAGWTNAHIGHGQAHIFLEFENNREVFPDGISDCEFLIRGVRVWDPRDPAQDPDDQNTWQWSQNAVLCALHYVRFYGAHEVPFERLPLTWWIAGINVCDEDAQYTEPGGTVTTEKRYTVNGSFQFTNNPLDILSQLERSFAGKIFRQMGQWYVRVGAWYGTPTYTVSEDDVHGNIKIKWHADLRDRANIVRATFSDPDQNYERTDAPPVEAAGYMEKDGQRLEKSISLPFVRSSTTAQRLSAIHLEQSRLGGIELPLKHKGLAAAVGRTIYVNLPKEALSNKIYRVVERRFRLDGGVTLMCIEDGPTLWADNLVPGAQDLTPNSSYRLGKPKPVFDVRVDVSDDEKAYLIWSHPAIAAVDKFELEIYQAGSLKHKTSVIDSQALLPDLGEGSFSAKLTAVNLFGQKSDTITFAYIVAAPARPTGLSYTQYKNHDTLQGRLVWDNPQNLKVIKHRIEIYAGTELIKSVDTAEFTLELFNLEIGSYVAKLSALTAKYVSEVATLNFAVSVPSPMYSRFGDPTFSEGLSKWSEDYVGEAISGVNNPNLSIVQSGSYGGNSAQISGQATLYWRQAIPVDVNKTYRMRFKVRQTQDPTSGGANAYAGVATLDKDFNNLTGGAGTHRYFAVKGHSIAVADGWQMFDAVITGVGLLDNQFRANTVYVRPMFIVNHASGNGIAEVDYCMFDEVLDADSIDHTDPRISNAAITGFVTEDLYAQEKAVLQAQIDKAITTWFYNGEPTLINEPALNWTTNEDKNTHLGDLYYDNVTGYAYRFMINATVYSWNKVSDSDVTKALADAAKAQDTADSKRRVFVAQPAPPYDVGDLWDTGAGIKRSTEDRVTGSYVSSDWVLVSDTTDYDSPLIANSSVYLDPRGNLIGAGGGQIDLVNSDTVEGGVITYGTSKYAAVQSAHSEIIADSEATNELARAIWSGWTAAAYLSTSDGYPTIGGLKKGKQYRIFCRAREVGALNSMPMFLYNNTQQKHVAIDGGQKEIVNKLTSEYQIIEVCSFKAEWNTNDSVYFGWGIGASSPSQDVNNCMVIDWLAIEPIDPANETVLGAQAKADAAVAAADAAAQAKANLAETTAKAYADGIVTEEEQRAIADAQAKADAAEQTAIAASKEWTDLKSSDHILFDINAIAPDVMPAGAPSPVGYSVTESKNVFSDFIPIRKGETIHCEMWAKQTGSSVRAYMGFERYDRNKKPIAGNDGTIYGGLTNTLLSTNWTKYTFSHALPTSHAPYNGSDGNEVCFVRCRLLFNYATTGQAYYSGYRMYRVPDQQYLPNVVAAGAGTALNVNPLSASDNGSSAKITIASHSRQYGFGSLSLNAGSITGLAFSTKYYVYYDDPTYSGGAVTYHATTNIQTVAAGNHRIFVSTITTPADGGGNTQPPPELCVTADMWLTSELKAEYAKSGDMLDTWWRGELAIKSPILQIRRSNDVRVIVEIETTSGAIVRVSAQTPIELKDHTTIKASDIRPFRDKVATLKGDGPILHWESVVRAEIIKEDFVYHISVGDGSFASGLDKNNRIVTHNGMMKP
ncbi:phage tail protein [Pseudoalteromonas sp. T1lg10]|uniref:phage tail protein n=1 Tax=Pseudoalteromonas sp. T1lg10 TaxID=2077093 RepID=UPI000CF6FC8F|nr:phage tail protein [Pseudoalteromonas sp. T1lg10]